MNQTQTTTTTERKVLGVYIPLKNSRGKPRVWREGCGWVPSTPRKKDRPKEVREKGGKKAGYNTLGLGNITVCSREGGVWQWGKRDARKKSGGGGPWGICLTGEKIRARGAACESSGALGGKCDGGGRGGKESRPLIRDQDLQKETPRQEE